MKNDGVPQLPLHFPYRLFFFDVQVGFSGLVLASDRNLEQKPWAILEFSGGNLKP